MSVPNVAKTCLQVIAILYSTSCVLCKNFNSVPAEQSERDPKLFGFVRIAPRVCGPIDNRGACFSSKDCMQKGGSVISGVTCANGFGICCSLILTCNADERRFSTNELVINLVTTTGARQCNFEVRKAHDDICQLQVDLVEFNLPVPDNRGNCQQAYLSFIDSVTVPNTFRLCGMLQMRRVFLTFEPGLTSTISFDSRLVAPSTHKLRVTQIRCNEKKVPDHCLEYYDETAVTNEVTSFGFPNYMINNPVYIICVESQPSSNQIKWDRCASPAPPEVELFRLSPWFSSDAGTVLAPLSGISACETTSYVDIIGENRHCGARLKVLPNDPGFISIVKPFSLAVRIVPDPTHAQLPMQFSFHYPDVPIPTPLCAGLGGSFASPAIVARALGMCALNTDISICTCARSADGVPPYPIPLTMPMPPRPGFCLSYEIS